MTKILALVALPLLLVLGVLSPSYAGSQAGVYGTLSAGNVSTTDGDCAQAEVAFFPNGLVEPWEFSGQVTAPSGGVVAALSFADGTPYNYVTLCSNKQAGVYTAAGTITIHSGGGTDTTEDYSTTFVFTVIHPKATVSIAVTTTKSHAKPCPGRANAHCWYVSAQVKRGGRYWVGRQVTFQAYDYLWETLARCTTKKYGKCGWYVITKKRGSARFPLRVISTVTPTTEAGVSRTFRLRYY